MIRRAAHVLEALARSDIRMRYGRGRLTMVKWLLDQHLGRRLVGRGDRAPAAIERGGIVRRGNDH